MSQVSRRPLNNKIEIQINKIFETAYTPFQRRLLTVTERKMISKRIAILLFNENGYNYREISELVKVSTSTIAYIVRLYNDNEQLRFSIKKLKRFQNNRKIIKDIFNMAEDILTYKYPKKSGGTIL